MSKFEPSSYQKAILNYIENNNGNLLVDAKAGSGKTSTLLLIADKILEQNKKCLFLAFNKSIVEELRLKIFSDDCQIKTIHSLGFTFLKSYLYRKHNKNYKLEIDNDKVKNLVDVNFEEICLDDFKVANIETGQDDLKELLYNVKREITNLCSFCRFYNIDYREPGYVIDLMYDHCHDLRDYKDIGLEKFPEVVKNVIDQIKYQFEHPEMQNGVPIYYVDFTDMIYFPCLYNMRVPYSLKDFVDYVLVDEGQDLSILQQKFITLLDNGSTRFLFVADEKQAIYGFAGADTKSVKNIKKNFQLTELPLNICYRCPENVIRVAKGIVPSIEWNKAREDIGKVEFFHEEDLKDKIQSNDVILARRNRDLIKLYKKLIIDEKISVKFKNIEMVNNLVNEIHRAIKQYLKLYSKYLNIEVELYADLKDNGFDINKESFTKEENNYVQKKAKEIISFRKSLNDKQIMKSNYTIDYLLKCMNEYFEKGAYNYVKEKDEEYSLKEYFSIIKDLIDLYKENNANTLVDSFIEYIKAYLKGNLDKDVPVLSSIHMMKGGEADNVFIIDYPKFPYTYGNQNDDDRQQEKNLQYVALTRAKKNLYLGLLDEEENENNISKNYECQINISKVIRK